MEYQDEGGRDIACRHCGGLDLDIREADGGKPHPAYGGEHPGLELECRDCAYIPALPICPLCGSYQLKDLEMQNGGTGFKCMDCLAMSAEAA